MIVTKAPSPTTIAAIRTAAANNRIRDIRDMKCCCCHYLNVTCRGSWQLARLLLIASLNESL
jgi:hypothetical protein